MAKTKNTIKTTPTLEEYYVEDSAEESSSRSSNKNAFSSIKDNIQQINKQLNSNPVYSIIFGGILWMISIYLLIAFISYFSTWQEDFDKVNSPLSILFSYETDVNNALGKIGALLSHIFMYRFYGIASFVIPISLMIWGYNKIRLKKTSFNLLIHTFFWLIWISLTLSFFLNERYPFAGGNYGEIMNNTLINYVGKWGLIVTLWMAIFIYFLINPNYIKLLKHVIVYLFSTSKNSSEKLSHDNVSANNKPENQVHFNNENDAQQEQQEQVSVIIEEEINKESIPESVEDNTEDHASENDIKFTIVTDEQAERTSIDVTQDTSEEKEEKEEEKSVDEIAERLVAEQGEYNPLADLSDYVYPGLDLLNDYGSHVNRVNQEELTDNKNKIIKTLKDYNISIQEIKATVGPTVTLYEIVPAPGIRISKIKNLENDIALSLAALGIRIIAPMPGKGTIGIEVPNQKSETVSMKQVLSSEKFQNCNYELPVALGKTINNDVFVADLAKMPHLLMAGATGQGKSVGLNAMLISLLYKKHPAELKFVLIDPKKVELTLYNKIERHFLAKLPNSEEAIITDTKKVIHTLHSLTIEMDNRYALLQDAQVRNIKEYNQKFIKRRLNPNDGHRYLPYIVVVIDEFADLIMTAGKEVEGPIARIAQLARAVGIHLIIATQRPSVNIITGVIKANFPARIAFKVSSKVDSRTILDAGGAEQLIGKGDMLYSAGSDLIRLQCAFVDTPEVEKVAEFIGLQRGYQSAFLLPEYVDPNEEGEDVDVDLSERDKLFDEAARLVVQFQQGSVSFLQRKLKIGFNRAGRLIDELEKAGIVGKFEGSKQRDVLIKDMAQLEELLRKFNE